MSDAFREGEPDTPPQIDTPLSLAAARELATKALRQAKSGSDPAAAKQRQRQEQLAAESDTLQAIAGEYLRREGPRLRTVGQRRSDLDLLCASTLGRLPVAEIKRGQFTRVLDHIADHNGPVRADRVLSAVKTLLAWHAERCDYVSVLGRGGRRTSIAERARSRVLNDAELKAVVETAEQRRDDPFAAFVLFDCTPPRDAVRRLACAAASCLTTARRGSFRRRGTRANATHSFRLARRRSGSLRRSRCAATLSSAPTVAGRSAASPIARPSSTSFAASKTTRSTICEERAERCWPRWRQRRHRRTCLGHALTGVRGTYDRHAYEVEKRRRVRGAGRADRAHRAAAE